MKSKILLAEDDKNLGFVTQDNLVLQGYDVVWSENGEDAISKFNEGEFDLCILDVMMPNMDGFSLASTIRETDSHVPIIFLTARSNEDDRLKGFEIGGDDYVMKPFSMKELLFRVDVFIRRSNQNTVPINSEDSELIGDYIFNRQNLNLELGDHIQRLTKMEADLVEILLRNKNQLVTRSSILIEIWGEDDYFKGRSLDVFISRLRKYLCADKSVKIINHHGVGFTLSC